MEALGEVKVRVSADITPLRAQLGGEALAEVKRFDSAASKAASNVGTALNPAIVNAKAFANALQAAGGDLSKINPALVGIGKASKEAAAAHELSAGKVRQLSTGLEHLAVAAATGEASIGGMTHAAVSMVHALGEGEGGAVGALKVVGSTVKSFVTNPIFLAVAAFGAATAAIGYFYEKFSLAGRAEAALKEHEETIQKIAAAWKRASSGSDEYRARSMEAIRFTANQDLRKQRELLADQLASARRALTSEATPQLQGRGFFPSNANTAALQQFTPAIRTFLQTAKEGRPDVEALNAEIQRLANLNPQDLALQKTAQRLVAVGQGAADTAERIKELNDALQELRINQAFEAASSQPTDRGVTDLNRRLQAELQALKARSPNELGNAARAREEATPFQSGESLAQRQFRIDAEGIKARTQAEIQLKEAMDQRVASMNKSLAAGQLELSLIGKTTAEIETQRMNFTLLEAAKEAAEKSHTRISETEIAQIHAVAEAYGKLQEQISAARETSDLLFERSNATKTAVERTVSSTLRGLGINQESETGRVLAQQIRFNEQLKITVNTLDDIRQGSASALTKFVQDLRSGVTWGQALKNMLSSVADALIKVGTSLIIKGLMGEQGQAGGGMFGGLLSRLLNRGQSASTGSGAGDVISGIFNAPSAAAANDNNPVGKQVWDFFASKGLPSHQVAGIVGNAQVESGFNPAARGAAGEYGLFQNLGDRKSGLFDFAKSTSPTVQQQLDYAWKEMHGPESRAFGNITGSQDVLGATKGMVGFERPQGFSWKNPESSMNFTGRYSAAQDALLKYGDSMSKTAGTFDNQFKSTLGGLANSTGQTAQGFSGSFQGALQSVVGGVGGKKAGGGGLFGFLGSLFGGGGLSAGAMALGTGGGAGLFAEGGVTNRPAVFGEGGGEGEAAIPLSRNRKIPVEFKASPKMMREVRSESKPSPHVTNIIQGHTITIEGSVDRKTLSEMERRLDERDGKLKDDLARGEIGGVTARYGSLKG